MRIRRNILELGDEFTVEVDRGDGMVIPVCGLCGNSGMVNTLATAELHGNKCGILAPCICPNGRYMKKMRK